MYKIYKKNNYLIIDDGATTPEEYLTKDILIKEIVTNVTYDIYGILPRLGNTSNQLLYTVNIANIIKENNSPYTANEWVDFYTSSTGVPSSNSNGGGGAGDASVPLSGTTVGNPIIGNLEMSFVGLKVKDDNEDEHTIGYTDLNGNVGITQGNNFIGISSGITRIIGDVISIDLDGSLIKIGTADVTSRGIGSDIDHSPNITDLDYTQKIYVDTHIAFTPIPTSSTDPGIKGQMAVDATYLYICVDTDTWTRVALAW